MTKFFQVQGLGQNCRKKYPYFGGIRISLKYSHDQLTLEENFCAKKRLGRYSSFDRTTTRDRLTDGQSDS